tara:strand:+ start:202838 stop:203284 length:447 start_codon:yes stop_codon:yes gene_type:complete
MTIHADLDQGAEFESQFRWVQNYYLIHNQAFILHAFDPASTGSGGQPDPFRKLSVGNAAIALKLMQNASVKLIQIHKNHQAWLYPPILFKLMVLCTNKIEKMPKLDVETLMQTAYSMQHLAGHDPVAGCQARWAVILTAFYPKVHVGH